MQALERPANDRDLRRELADAIADREAADARVRAAKAAYERADHLMCKARQAAEREKMGLNAAQRAATEAHAKAISEAIRAGKPAPATPAPAALNSAPLAAALAQFRAFEMAASELSGELALAKDAAAKAANTVRDIIDLIVMEGEARALARQVVTSMETHWQLCDRLSGLILIDEARREGPRLRDLQNEILLKIDRRKRAVAENALYIEDHNWRGYLDGLADAQRQKWLDYASRLANDPAAVFDPEPKP